MGRQARVTSIAPWTLAAAAIIAGCATQAPQPVSVPPPPLQLLSSAKLQIPDDCAFHGGTMYRTSYVVQGNGRVTDVQPPRAPSCLQAALTQWVDSFVYAPPGVPVPTLIDWMGVPGRRLP